MADLITAVREPLPRRPVMRRRDFLRWVRTAGGTQDDEPLWPVEEDAPPAGGSVPRPLTSLEDTILLAATPLQPRMPPLNPYAASAAQQQNLRDAQEDPRQYAFEFMHTGPAAATFTNA
jgi:hypothetical protein